MIDFLMRVLALLCESYYEIAKQLVLKDHILALIAPIMTESEEYERQKQRKRLVRGAAILFASITASRRDKQNQSERGDKSNKIHDSLARETGLISTFFIKLVTLKDQAILKRVFQVIGNLAHLQQLQSDDFLLKGGIEAIIKYLDTSEQEDMQDERDLDDEEQETNQI